MRLLRLIHILPLLLLPLSMVAQKSSVATHSIDIVVSEKGSREPVVMATCILQPIGLYAVTDLSGKARLQQVPEGDYTLQVSYVGLQPANQRVRVNKDLTMRIQMTETSLALSEVTVVARQNASGTSTSSIIGRQAIDHLQAASLADIMQLVPGAVMGNVDLTSTQNTRLQIRSASQDAYNSTSAFGSPVIIDGVPMSNNGNMTQGNFSATAITGTDLRSISADDIDEVEVVRGIPSAEYGDLTSGMVVVHSKIGVTPWQVKGKVNPAMMNYSLGKGLRTDKYGVLNFNIDYAQAWGDPRKKTNSFDRYNLSVGYGIDISRRWHTDTKLRYSYSKDWSGQDPDAIQDGTEAKSTNKSMTLTHNGKIKVDRLLSRNVNYTIGLSLTQADSRNTAFAGGGLTPIYTAMTTGYYALPFVTTSYKATGISESRPGNVYAKVNNSFYLRSGKTYQNFKMGIDYRYDWNSGRGYYNEDEQLPLRPNGSSRPRPFDDVPGLHQVAAYAEDNLSWQYWGKRSLRVQLGGRFTAMQPFDADVRTFAFSPRLNMSIELTSWLSLRGGIGLNSKTPGLNYLYPDKHYSDYAAASYMPQNDPAAQLFYGYTHVYDVEFSRNLKNVNTTKIEAGFDVKLPGSRKLSVIAYEDRTTNGFASLTEYLTYPVNYYNEQQGLIITPGQATTVDQANPAFTKTMWTTTGRIGNTDVNINRGVEFDFDLGKIQPIGTRIYLSGAWQETKSKSKALHYGNPTPMPTTYSSYNTTPLKMVWPAEQELTRYQQFLTTLRLVTNIPQLRMVASLTGQVIWHHSTMSETDHTRPIGWITPDLRYHEITDDMLGGYITTEGQYVPTAAAVSEGYAAFEIAKQSSYNYNYNKNPITWNLSARLTKEFGKMAGLSFYANNVMFYEPFLTQSNSRTLTQRNTGTFSFGVELFFNL
ncbi:MAG: carboxypeptidase-like regulatory domain-containing protein [Prevotella sp.]|nr:carboxypeptidase-like regulatory domain-containing protein [Prevotella sp.]